MNLLDEFGETLITQVRDLTSETYFDIKSGNLKSKEAKEMHMMISNMTESDKAVLDEVVADVIDRSIFNMLLMFENNDVFTISRKVDHSNDLVESSDGISGELYGLKGWFARFSKNYFNRKDSY